MVSLFMLTIMPFALSRAQAQIRYSFVKFVYSLVTST